MLIIRLILLILSLFFSFYLTGIEFIVFWITGCASESSKARAPPKTATKARTVATPANSESANEGGASGSKRSLLSLVSFSARATTEEERPPPATKGRIELDFRIGGDVLRAALLGAGGFADAAAARTSEKLAERGVAQEEARIDWN